MSASSSRRASTAPSGVSPRKTVAAKPPLGADRLAAGGLASRGVGWLRQAARVFQEPFIGLRPQLVGATAVLFAALTLALVAAVRDRRDLAYVAAAFLTGGGLAASLMARRIARPLRELADGLWALGRGDLGRRITPTAADETGELGRAFNHIGVRLLEQRAVAEATQAELRQRLAELAELQSYQDSILGCLTTGVVTLDLEGRVVMANPAAESLIGRALGDLRGHPWTEVFAHIPQLDGLLRETRVSRTGGARVSAIAGRPDMPSLPVEMITAPLKSAEGDELGVVLVLRDLSAVRQWEDQLRRSDRLAALGSLAARLAHEIKNPLTSLLTFTRHLSRRFGDERFRQRFQSVVPRELERINSIVDGLLQLARPTRLSLRAVSLPDILEQALELYDDQMETKQVAVVRDYTRDLPPIQGDREHLYQAFVNLIANALDAMPAGGTLTVRAGWGDEGEYRPSRPWFRERHLKVDIEDTGMGIPAAEAFEVFNPFFTTKPGGTGLGLAIVHKIVEDHGGTITFQSAPGKGTTFTVLLPLTVGRRPERKGDGARLGLPGSHA